MVNYYLQFWVYPSSCVYINVLDLFITVNTTIGYNVIKFYDMFRKRKWSAADASEPECVSHVELKW
jgi:hypothetical protein